MSDLSDFGPGPDISTIDDSKLDFGNDPVAKAAEPEPTPAPTEAPKAEEPPKVEEPKGPEEEPKADKPEPARDEKGRFQGTIPLDRHKATLEKEREARDAAERRAAALEQQLAERERAQVSTQRTEEAEKAIEALEEKHADLLLDGKTKEAAAVMKQIRTMEREIAVAEAEQRATAATAQALENERSSAVIARLEADFPALNPQSEEYDQDIVDLVLSKQRALMGTGMPPSQALDKAARDVGKRFLTAQKVEEPAPQKGLDAGKVAQDRQQRAVDQALAAQKAQPATLREVGMDSDRAGEKELPDVSKMTADEFAALPAATQARLLGNMG